MLQLYLLFVYFWTEKYVFFKKIFKELKGFRSFDKQLSKDYSISKTETKEQSI